MQPGRTRHLVANFGVDDHAVGTDAGVAADSGLAAQLNKRLDDSVRPDFDVAVNHARIRIENGDAIGHQLLALGQAHALVNVRQFGAGVAAQNLVGIASLHGDDALFGLAENRRPCR